VKLDFYVICFEYFEVGFTVSQAKIEIQKTGSLRAGMWRVKMLSTFLPLLLLCDFHGKLSAGLGFVVSQVPKSEAPGPPSFSGGVHFSSLPPAVGLAALARGLGFVVPTLRQKKAKDGAPNQSWLFKGAPPAVTFFAGRVGSRKTLQSCTNGGRHHKSFGLPS
jgi:hypothetical protein